MILKRVCIIGWGNISRYVKYSLDNSLDFELTGVVRRSKTVNEIIPELFNVNIVDNISKLKDIDIAILCVPSRNIELITEDLIKNGINSINCSDDEDKDITYFKNTFENLAKENNVRILHGFGFNPGIKNIIENTFNMMINTGIKKEYYGPGISMKYTSDIKNVEGVKNVIVFIEPISISKNALKIYLEIDKNTDFIQVRKKILNLVKLKDEDIDIELVDDVRKYLTLSLKYNYSIIGNSSYQTNQNINFDMNINIAAIIGQLLVNGARICLKKEAGVYGCLDIQLKELMQN